MNSTVLLVVVGFVWLVWSMLNLAIARAKNRDVGGVFALSLFLSPVLGYLYVAAVPALPTGQQPSPKGQMAYKTTGE